MTSDPSLTDALADLAPAEAEIRAFIEAHLADECGLLRSHLNATTLRPWTNAELAGCDTLPIYRAERGDPAAQLGYEDSLMATGEYAESQLHRFRATGEPEALATAAWPIAALLRVFHEGERYEPGYLPKPHGGMRRAAYSHEISPDQYLKAYVALRAYQPYAPPAQAREIERCLLAVADYFLHRDFQHPYRERTLVNPETRPHCVTLYLPSVQVAWKLTGDERYRAAFARFNATLDALAAGAMEVNFNLCSLFVEGCHLALSEGLEDDRLREIIRQAWRVNLELVDADGTGRQGLSIPLRTSRVVRMAAVAPLVEQHLPEVSATSTALAVLAAHRDPRAMTYYTEYDPDHLRPGHRFLVDTVCETSLSSWLVAYWRLKTLT